MPYRRPHTLDKFDRCTGGFGDATHLPAPRASSSRQHAVIPTEPPCYVSTYVGIYRVSHQRSSAATGSPAKRQRFQMPWAFSSVRPVIATIHVPCQRRLGALAATAEARPPAASCSLEEPVRLCIYTQPAYSLTNIHDRFPAARPATSPHRDQPGPSPGE